MTNNQNTIRNEVRVFGRGVHSGDHVSLVLKPAPVNTGILFCRTDLPVEQSFIKANFNHVSETRLSTSIANEFGATVSTIEHLMAALWGARIDNVIVEVDNKEMPIMDGSSKDFIFLIESAGILEQKNTRNRIQIMKDFEFTHGDSKYKVSPSDDFNIVVDIEFANKVIAKQSFEFSEDSDSFKNDISKARTFGFLHEVEYLRSIGLARGGSLSNAIVIDGDQIMNEEGLRYPDEFVRHKLLDCIGDFYLAGATFAGKFECSKPSHASNNMFLRELFADSSVWCYNQETIAA
jgi:UDP-3-O-[3-hydroxymyristoyl] N-acetylglucosamine deacetylase